MSEQLLIRMGETLDCPIHWLIYNKTDNEIIGSGELANSLALDSLSEKAASRPVVLLLPASQAQLKRVKLPTKWSRKLEQALPFMLEEELAGDIDDVFIAPHKPGSEADAEGELQHYIDVAMLTRSWFENHLEALKAAEINPSFASIDALLLPKPAADTITAVQLGEQWLMRFDDWQVAMAEASWAETLLLTNPQNTLVHYSPCDFTAKTLTTDETKYDLPLALFAKSLTEMPFNLLQGPYQVKKQSNKQWQQWRGLAIAASVALVFALGVKGAQAIKYHQEAEQLKATAIATYQQAFPSARIQPHLLRKQIESKLRSQGGSTDAQFMALLNTTASVLSTEKTAVLQTLRFDARRGELRVRARAKGFQAFGRIKGALEQQGLSVEQGSLNNDGDFVVGEIRIKEAV